MSKNGPTTGSGIRLVCISDWLIGPSNA